MMHHDFLYTKRLPTLGRRIGPALLRRLVAVAQSDDGILVDSIAHAIARVADDEIGARIVELLDHSSPFVKRAAMKVLALQPIAIATDRLWALHREILAECSKFARPHEQTSEPSSDSFAALRECVKLDPEWLSRSISAADAMSDPVHVLATLIAIVQNNPLWQQCKAELFKKVRPEHEVPLVINIFRYRDPNYSDWLRERIDRRANLIGPWALRALTRLDADAAIAELPRLPIQVLSPTKRWCYSELQRRRPEAAKCYILGLLKRPQPVLEAAMVYKEREGEVDAETLAVLFELLEGVLDAELTGTCEDSSPALYVLASLLADMRYPHQLPEFVARKDRPLAAKLTQWLLRRGPIPDEFARPDLEYALTILERIGGDGLTHVFNCYLTSANPIARREVLFRAALHPNADTKELLRAISRQPDLEKGCPIDQSLATYALALAGEYRPIIEAVVQWGRGIFTIDLTRQLPGAPLSDEEVVSVLDAIREGRVTSGTILAIGIAGRSEHTDIVRAVLQDYDPSSELGYAALIALCALRDSASEIVPFISRHLLVIDHRKAALQALRTIGTNEALETIHSHVESSYSDDLALSLLTNERSSARVAPLLRRRLQELDGPQKTELLARLVLTVQDPKVLSTVLDEESTRSLLYDAAFAPEQDVTVTGARFASIRALAKLDADAAFDAAKAALLSPDFRDREYYPSLLVEIDPDAAVSSLLDVIQTEKHAAIRRAIGRSLASLQPESCVRLTMTLNDWLKESEPCRRKAAAEVLGYVYQPGEQRIENVRQLLDDASEDVVKAASRALDRAKSVEATCELVKAVHQESDLSWKKVLLDALIETADPGDAHREPPEWYRQTQNAIPALWREYLNSRVTERRKVLLEVNKDD